MIVTAASTQELIPGYIATERLGAGGYGEVWKVEAPGGLHKAIKIIYGFHDEERASRELKSLDHVRKVRHPFLLSLERIEVVDGRLMIVTELADMSLMDRYEQCRKGNLPGIPRDELINHMRDAADALDFMIQTHSLQHLDVKPENLLLVSGRAKVADFGLVKEIADKTRSLVGAMTPTYAAPEVFDGRATRQSDQYSLAIVYQEMLTGVLPFPGRTAAQLAAQHTRSRPQLSALPPGDREIIGRSLSKKAEDRYPSCRDMIDALLAAGRPVTPVAQSAPAPVISPPTPRPIIERPDAGTRNLCLDDTHTTGPLPTNPDAAPLEQRTEIIARQPATPAPAEPVRNKPTPQPRDAKPSPRAASPAPRPASSQKLASAHRFEIPSVQVSLAVRDVELSVNPAATAPGLRPTCLIGVGGTGALALEKLRSRLHERYGHTNLSEPFPQLLVETDPAIVKRTVSSGLDHQDTALLALKQAHEYRGEADHLLAWIGRRWLYNVPKDGLTSGFRPWGRLAIVDRAGQIVVKLRQRLTKLTSGAVTKALEQHGETVAPEATPRVVLFGSCNGGTGGGMLIELAYAVRNINKQLGNKPLEICAIVTTSTNQCATSKQLATANTVAFLTELQHYARCGAHGENGSDTRAAMFEGADFPLDHVYLVDLGDDLSCEAYDEQVERLADYLYCDTATPLASWLTTAREPQPEEEQHLDLHLRSLRMARFEGIDNDLLPALTLQLSSLIAERWLAPSARKDGVTRYLESQAHNSDTPVAPPTIADKALERLLQSQTFAAFLAREQLPEVPPELRGKPAHLKQLAVFDWQRKELLSQLQSVAEESPASISTRELAALFPRGFDIRRLNTLTERANALADPLINDYLLQIRKVAEHDPKSAHGPKLLAAIRKVAGREALTIVKEWISDVEVAPDGQVRRATAPAQEYLNSDKPLTLRTGCERRTLLLAQGGFDTPTKRQYLSVNGQDRHTYICEEMQGISLAHAAALYAEKDAQALAAIEHLHSRQDIAWSELATVECVP